MAAPAAAAPVSGTTPAMGAGACVAVQQRVNGGLTGQVGEALVTALVPVGSRLGVAVAMVADRPEVAA